jgi:hypothetical protein
MLVDSEALGGLNCASLVQGLMELECDCECKPSRKFTSTEGRWLSDAKAGKGGARLANWIPKRNRHILAESTKILVSKGAVPKEVARSVAMLISDIKAWEGWRRTTPKNAKRA